MQRLINCVAINLLNVLPFYLEFFKKSMCPKHLSHQLKAIFLYASAQDNPTLVMSLLNNLNL